MKFYFVNVKVKKEKMSLKIVGSGKTSFLFSFPS